MSKLLANRLKRLKRKIRAVTPEGECRKPCVGGLVWNDEPDPPDHEIGRCRTCGGRHVGRVVEVIVEERAEADRMIDVLCNQSGINRI